MTFMQKLRKSAKEKKGFTLIELIIVIAIIAILIALIAPNLVKFLSTAKGTSVDANAKTAYTSIQTYLTELETKGTTVTANDGASDAPYDIVTDGVITTTAPFDTINLYFNAKELKGVSITAVVGANNALKSVTWTKAGTPGATYPKQ